MEMYSKLLQDTKNDRLHYLLNQTDTYLATINKMVEEQRVEGEEELDENQSTLLPVSTVNSEITTTLPSTNPSTSTLSGSVVPPSNKESVPLNKNKPHNPIPNTVLQPVSTVSVNRSVSASQKYYDSTHKRLEKVIRPCVIYNIFIIYS